MSRYSAALALLAALAAPLFGAEPKRRPSPKPAFFRPSLEMLRKGRELPNREPLAPDENGVYQLTAREELMTLPMGDGEQPVRLYSYNKQLVGPTIVTRPGAALAIRVTNHLVPKPDEPPAPGENDYHGFNVTNLHTHGLNVTPCDPGDNVYREIRRGFSHTFRYRLPADHVPGTYFYHPHKHGSVGYQVGCGMVGALIVKDLTRGLDSIPEIRGVSDQVLVFEQLDMYPDPKDPKAPWSLTPTQFYNPPDPDGKRNVSTAINGQVAPRFKMKRGEVVRWRVVHGGIEEVIQLAFAPDPAGKPPKKLPQMYQIAWDGIPLGTRGPPICVGEDGKEVPNCLQLYPGNRAEVLVKAPDEDGNFLLQSPPLPKSRSLRGVAQAALPLAYVQVEGAPDFSTQTTLPTPEAVQEKTKDCIPPDLSGANVTVRRTFELKSDDPTFVFQINGTSFDPGKVTNVFLRGDCEEWCLKATNGPAMTATGHPFHVHVNPFQVLQIDGQPVKRPYWADTLFVPVGHSATVRTRFRHFTGKTVLHCHILDHEDAGMMHAVFIEPPGVACPPRGPAAGLGGALPPRAAALVRPGGAKLDPAGGTTVLVFFQGAGCPSCVRQLKALVRERRRWGDGVQLVAVSSEPIGDYGRLRRLVGAGPADPVAFCADPGLAVFKDMGCEDDGPLHGTFVIRGGKVVWKDVGFVPLEDLGALGRVLRVKSAGRP
jgi:FtsP/CotA-like multicopper oxidase with cupredoxin domain